MIPAIPMIYARGSSRYLMVKAINSQPVSLPLKSMGTYWRQKDIRPIVFQISRKIPFLLSRHTSR